MPISKTVVKLRPFSKKMQKQLNELIKCHCFKNKRLIFFTFRCEIYKLPAKVPATIEIRSRLWNSTLAEDYLNVDLVEIYSKARVVVDTDISQV